MNQLAPGSHRVILFDLQKIFQLSPFSGFVISFCFMSLLFLERIDTKSTNWVCWYPHKYWSQHLEGGERHEKFKASLSTQLEAILDYMIQLFK